MVSILMQWAWQTNERLMIKSKNMTLKTEPNENFVSSIIFIHIHISVYIETIQSCANFWSWSLDTYSYFCFPFCEFIQWIKNHAGISVIKKMRTSADERRVTKKKEKYLNKLLIGMKQPSINFCAAKKNMEHIFLGSKKKETSRTTRDISG